MFITVSVAVVYVYTTELFPTDVRALAFGTANIFARIGGLISPFIVGPSMADVNKTLPLVILGVVAGLAALVAFSLPETRGLSLPDTLLPRTNHHHRQNSPSPSLSLAAKNPVCDDDLHHPDNDNDDDVAAAAALVAGAATGGASNGGSLMRGLVRAEHGTKPVVGRP